MSKHTPARYRTMSWSGYNAALRKRGSLLHLGGQKDGVARAAWGPSGPPTGLLECGDPVLPIDQCAFHAAAQADRQDGRQPAAAPGAGLAHSRLLYLMLQVEDPNSQILYRQVGGLLNLLMDSTGIKFLDDSEWQACKHGIQGRRQWRKIHLAMDTVTSDIRAVGFHP